jgi:phage-related minor tail protein
MAKKTNTVNVAVTADAKKFRKEFDKASKEVGKFQQAAGKAFKAFAKVGIGAAIGVGAAIGKAALDFQAMEGILIKGTGATGAALEDLKTQAMDVMKAVPESADIVAGALADVNTHLGLTGDDLEGTTKTFLDFARVTGVDVGTAVGQLDAQLTQFGLGVGDTEEVLGDLVRISQATGAPMEKLLKQMETFGPIFANAGFSAEETAATFGQLEQAGVDVTRVGPALNKFFRDAAAEGKNPKEALKGTVDAINAAATSADALNIATAAFGAEGAQRMVSAIKSGNFELEEFGGLMGEGVGVVDEQAKATATLSDKFNILKNKVLVALAPVAIRVMDSIMVAMDRLMPIIDNIVISMTEFFKSEGFANFVEGVKTAAEVAIEAGKLIWENLKLYVGLLVDLFNGDWQDAWDKVKEIVSTTVAFIKEHFSEVPELLWKAIKAGSGLLLAAGMAIGEAIMRGIRDALGVAVQWTTNVAKSIANALIRFMNTNVIDKLNRAVEFTIGLPFGQSYFVNPPDIPGIPALAEGGIVSSPMLALIGEAGPEAVVPLDGRHGMGGTQNITINVTGVSGEEVIEAIRRETQRRGAAVFPTVTGRRT